MLAFMKLQKPSTRDSRLLLMASALVLLCAAPALAQESNAQLSDKAAEQQVPASFPDINIPTSNPEDAAKKPATKTATGEAVAEGEAPQAPEEKKLVPATAMGAAAQKVENNKTEGTPATASADEADEAASDLADALGAKSEGEASSAATEEKRELKLNPAEDDLGEDSAPALPDILEKYSAKADEVGEMNKADALPAVNAPAMSDLALDPTTGQPVNASGQTKEQLQQEITQEAYDAALTGTFPLSPEQIRELLKRYDKTQEAVETPVYDTPKPEITVQNISLDPGIIPPVIKTAVGNVTTINMLDATGSPWPVQDVTWAGDFEVVEPEEGGHVVRITPMEHFARGNIVIRLLTLKTPLTLTLETSRDTVQYRVDARIPEYGPFAAAPLISGGGKSTMVAGSPDLTNLLDGVMPGGMEKLSVGGVDGRTTAYSMNGTTYVRTPLTLMSPAWHSSVSSADGMNVYALTNAPVLLLSDGGEFMRATLSEKKDLLDE